ncbi:MAG: PTS fructose transporter subunit IIA [Elusimicrobia bacterium]|nr:PTS fructose transporter subunit IIA [Elusimicrobiota bacterium]
MINFIVVTHGEFGAYLVEAAEAIVGRQAAGVRSLSVSARHSLGETRGRLEKTVRDLADSDGLIVFTDMQAGTPVNLAFPVVKDKAKTELVSGVNLAMLVTAFNHRSDMTLAELRDKVLKNGRGAVCDFKALVKERSR